MGTNRVLAEDVERVSGRQVVFLPGREGGMYQLVKHRDVYRLRPLGNLGILGVWETSPEGEATESPPVTPQRGRGVEDSPASSLTYRDI